MSRSATPVVICQDCLRVYPYTDARHNEEEFCECGGQLCGCEACQEFAQQNSIAISGEAAMSGVVEVETEVQFVERMLAEPNDDLLRLVRLCRRDENGEGYNAAYEQLYKDAVDRNRAAWPDDYSAPSLRTALVMLERWIPDALPVNSNGQVHFARALIESAMAAIKAAIEKGAE